MQRQRVKAATRLSQQPNAAIAACAPRLQQQELWARADPLRRIAAWRAPQRFWPCRHDTHNKQAAISKRSTTVCKAAGDALWRSAVVLLALQAGFSRCRHRRRLGRFRDAHGRLGCALLRACGKRTQIAAEPGVKEARELCSARAHGQANEPKDSCSSKDTGSEQRQTRDTEGIRSRNQRVGSERNARLRQQSRTHACRIACATAACPAASGTAHPPSVVVQTTARSKMSSKTQCGGGRRDEKQAVA
jgi:hypothetical protein